MKHLKLTLSFIAAAALLTACGGNDNQFTQVVTFGDSISDNGAYRVGTIAQLGGGKFTVNGPDDKVWPEALAANLGLPAQCPAQTGLLPNNGITGAPVTNFAACYNYAQGSSRVTSVGSGPDGVALQQPPFNLKTQGKLADSIQNQMNRHLAKAGTFGANELVTVNGGGNDFFMQLNAVGAAAGGCSSSGRWRPGRLADGHLGHSERWWCRSRGSRLRCGSGGHGAGRGRAGNLREDADCGQGRALRGGAQPG